MLLLVVVVVVVVVVYRNADEIDGKSSRLVSTKTKFVVLFINCFWLVDA